MLTAVPVIYLDFLFRILEKAKEMKGQQAQSEHCVMKIFVEEKKDIEHIPEFHVK
jgi:hypothetical protein